MVGLPLAALFILTLLTATPATSAPCAWQVNMGSNSIDPRSAPLGPEKYIVQCTGPESCATVLAALQQRWGSGDVDSVREMRSLGSMFTAKLSSAAVRWMCETEEISKHVVGLEADQVVSVGGARSRAQKKFQGMT